MSGARLRLPSSRTSSTDNAIVKPISNANGLPTSNSYSSTQKKKKVIKREINFNSDGTMQADVTNAKNNFDSTAADSNQSTPIDSIFYSGSFLNEAKIDSITKDTPDSSAATTPNRSNQNSPAVSPQVAPNNITLQDQIVLDKNQMLENTYTFPPALKNIFEDLNSQIKKLSGAVELTLPENNRQYILNELTETLIKEFGFAQLAAFQSNLESQAKENRLQDPLKIYHKLLEIYEKLKNDVNDYEVFLQGQRNEELERRANLAELERKRKEANIIAAQKYEAAVLAEFGKINLGTEEKDSDINPDSTSTIVSQNVRITTNVSNNIDNGNSIIVNTATTASTPRSGNTNSARSNSSNVSVTSATTTTEQKANDDNQLTENLRAEKLRQTHIKILKDITLICLHNIEFWENQVTTFMSLGGSKIFVEDSLYTISTVKVPRVIKDLLGVIAKLYNLNKPLNDLTFTEANEAITNISKIKGEAFGRSEGFRGCLTSLTRKTPTDQLIDDLPQRNGNSFLTKEIRMVKTIDKLPKSNIRTPDLTKIYNSSKKKNEKSPKNI